MVIQLKKLAKEGEIQEGEMSEIKTIEGWITKYSASLRKESAKQRVMDNNENQESWIKTSKRPKNDSKNAQQKYKRQKR